MKGKKRYILLAALLAALLLYNSFALHISGTGAGSIVYSYGDIRFSDALSEQEIAAVVSILNGKLEFPDNPSCGFTEKCAIIVDGIPFALACDGCEVVKNCETGKYISISKADRDVLEKMFRSRGGVFPCV